MPTKAPISPAPRFLGPLLGVIALLLALTPAAPAQTGKSFDPLSGLGQVAAPAEPVTVSVTPSSTSVAPGGRLVLAVILAHQPGWHSHTHDPQPPESWGFDAIPTRITVTGHDALKQGQIQWPEEHVITADLGGTGTPEPYAVYEGNATAFIPLELPADASGTLDLTLTVAYQACDDTTCDRPQKETHTVSVTLDPAAAAQDLSAAPFADFDAATGFATLAAATPSLSETDPATTDTGMASEEGETLATTNTKGLLALGLLAALGGFVLNLTPCVLPVIPIKVMTLVKHGGEHRSRTLLLGFWMALGVVTFWVAIGLPMAFVSEKLDPSRVIFGNWWVNIALGLLIAFLGVGIMGLFTINLPKAVYAVNPRADSAHGSFLFGVMTAVLGLPCFGFVAASLLAGAATMSALQIMTVFGGLGVGMALPYFVLAAYPGLLNRIPRTGPASELVKQVLGLLMIAGAVFFLAIGLYTVILERPWLAQNMKWWGAAFFIALAGFWLTYRTFQISKKPAPRIVFPAIALAGTLASGWFAADSTSRLKEEYLARATVTEPDGYLLDNWNHYTPARFARAIADGKTVMVDFTAEWCINCKGYKRGVLDRDPVLSRIQQDDVVYFEADTTSNTDPANDFMEELGITGIPQLAIFGPAIDAPLLSNNATGAEVVRRLNRASGSPTTSASR